MEDKRASILYHQSLTARLPDDQLLVHLQSISGLFKAMGLEVSSHVVEEIQSIISTKSDISKLYTLFKQLQIATEEFAATEYTKRCMNYLMRISRTAMQKNPVGVAAVMNDPIFAEIQRERSEAFTVVTKISNILEHGATTAHEKILGLSFSYSHVVEGVFKKSVQDCYLIHEISEMRPVNVREVEHFGVAKLLEYYKSNGNDTTIFEGWDDVVRNAVVHTRIHYDDKLDKMTFVDRTSKRNRTSTYSFAELQQMYVKLFDVYSLVLIRNQIWRVNDIIYALELRYGGK